MKRLVFSFVFCCVLIISAFLLFGGIESWIEVNLTSNQSLLTYTALSFFFLTFDVVLPVPSSLLMVLNGKVLGLLLGSLTSLAAGLLSSCIGFYLGRKASPWLDKLFSGKDQAYGADLLNKIGPMAIALSKALPILSEAVSVVAGTTTVSFKAFFGYSFIGHAVVALLYAYVGSYTSTLDSTYITAAVILSVLFFSWFVQVLVKKAKPVAENV